ncbi:MAG: hypothetical protein AUJ85_03920 [Elusimicrobia bacterium CG1_02_37_114]|nr:MAG: hypothetical protein AUJ85_03920 [Elusimicrobia bacterium CG1_02_37_114]
MLVIFLVTVYFRNILKELPSVDSLREYTPTLSTKIYDINAKLITELFTERRSWVPLSKIPIDLQNAVISMEDHKFFSHWGVSFRGMTRAFRNNILRYRKSIAGGSTITQQLAKLAFLSREKTIRRKIKEFLLALQLERNFSKQEILETYLNQVWFGHGAYGVEQAAMMYFQKNTSDLTLGECALLAGLLRYPGYYSPFNNIDRAIYRTQTALSRMHKLEFISEKEKFEAFTVHISTQRTTRTSRVAPYFIEDIRLMLEKKYGDEIIYRAGWNIYTTLDLDMQVKAEKALNDFLDNFDKTHGYKFISSTEVLKVQGALLATDPKTGQIRAMIGGRNFAESQFNRAIQAYRQPGSAFKPIVYTAAIENGYTPTTIIEDAPVVYVNDGRDWRLAAKTTDFLLTLPDKWLKDPMKVWTPENYKKKYHSKVLLRQALEHSLNVCAVRVVEEISPVTVISYARRLGITSPLTNTFSLALGASDVKLLETVRVFNTLANNGIRTEPYYIIRIEDKDGRLIEENRPVEEDVLSPQTSFIMTNLLKGVVEHGTGQYAKYLRRPSAGKTGTTNDFTDAWFIGYTPQLVCGVWVGYDNKVSLGNKMTGGSLACPIWTHFMKEALKGEPVLDFTPPPTGITFAYIDSGTGLLANTTEQSESVYLEAFLKGTEPKTCFIPETTGNILLSPKEFEEDIGY